MNLLIYVAISSQILLMTIIVVAASVHLLNISLPQPYTNEFTKFTSTVCGC